MSYLALRPIPLRSKHALTGLFGAALLALPVTASLAGSNHEPNQIAQNADKSPAAREATSMKPETVEERIGDLHRSLEITPAEDAKWNSVAQAMRVNAAAMEKLTTTARGTPPEQMTAVQDLKTYAAFAQAHVDGLKSLTASFDMLYDVMPAAQKKIADTVFMSYGTELAAAHE
jgi:hypothetical protein